MSGPGVVSARALTSRSGCASERRARRPATNGGSVKPSSAAIWGCATGYESKSESARQAEEAQVIEWIGTALSGGVP